jgi:signal transduction histidine kinase
LRRRIASELHDHISQDLAISKMKLESLADPAKSDLNASLKEVIGLIAHTIDVSRSLTFEMSPPVLYELGFEAAIGWLVNQTRKRFGLNAEFTDDGKPKPLDTDVRVTLFHAVRELLINVVKHAKARMVKVSASQVRGHVQITVEDDGIGFDASRKTGGGHVSHKAGSSDYTSGFGLFNIRERLSHIGGKVNIRSKPGKGTRVTLIAPLNIKTKRLRGVKK